MFVLEEGVGSSVPGVQWIQYAKCYAPYVWTRDVDVGDVFNWPHEVLYARVVRAFAETHNQRVVALLKRTRKTQCRPTTNWGAAWTDLDSYLATLDRTKAHAAYAGRASGVDFNVTIPEAGLAARVQARACAIFAAHDATPVVIRLQTWPRTELGHFRCPDA